MAMQLVLSAVVSCEVLNSVDVAAWAASSVVGAAAGADAVAEAAAAATGRTFEASLASWARSWLLPCSYCVALVKVLALRADWGTPGGPAPGWAAAVMLCLIAHVLLGLF